MVGLSLRLPATLPGLRWAQPGGGRSVRLLCGGTYHRFSHLGMVYKRLFMYVTTRVSCWTLLSSSSRQPVGVAIAVGGRFLEVPVDFEKWLPRSLVGFAIASLARGSSDGKEMRLALAAGLEAEWGVGHKSLERPLWRGLQGLLLCNGHPLSSFPGLSLGHLARRRRRLSSGARGGRGRRARTARECCRDAVVGEKRISSPHAHMPRSHRNSFYFYFQAL